MEENRMNDIIKVSIGKGGSKKNIDLRELLLPPIK